jgi:hypothetical protein
VFLEIEDKCHGGSRLSWQGVKLIVEIRKRRYKTMQTELIVALVVAIPIILFPAAYVWYLNVGGVYAAVKEARARKAAQEKEAKVKVVAR